MCDQHGSGLVQTLVVLALLALGGMTAVKKLADGINRKSQCTGEAIANLVPGMDRCGGGGSAPGDPAAGRPLEGEGGSTSAPPFPPQSHKDLSPEQFQEYATVLEQARSNWYLFPDWLLEHRDPVERARMFDLAANFGFLGETLDHASDDPESRRVMVEALKSAFDSGSVTPEEFARSIRPSGSGSLPGETHENLASIVAATGDPAIVEAFLDGEMNALDVASEDVIRLPAMAKALDGLSASDREALLSRRPDIETVLDIHDRHGDLQRAGLRYVDTDLFSPVVAIRVVDNPENRKVIDDMARRYGVDPALLEGVIASEIDFDRDRKDVILDDLGRKGIGIGQGWGVAAVHGDTLDRAID